MAFTCVLAITYDVILTSYHAVVTLPLGWHAYNISVELQIDISGELSSELKDVFKVCLGLSYILVATYLIQFFMYWLWQKAFTDESSSPAAASGEKLD